MSAPNSRQSNADMWTLYVCDHCDKVALSAVPCCVESAYGGRIRRRVLQPVEVVPVAGFGANPGRFLVIEPCENCERLQMQVDNLTAYVADICDEANAIVPISTLEGMGRMRDELSAEVHDLREQIALVPPALWAAAQGRPHGEAA